MMSTLAVRPMISLWSWGGVSSRTRTGMRCARRTQLNVGFTLASRLELALRSRSSMPAAMLST
jgi:hypothetical protein